MTRAVPARAALALAAALAACAPGVAEGPPAGPSPFRSVKKLVLVRRVDDPRATRGRDALDALKESLGARGYEARIVEVGRSKDAALRDVERLEERIGARFWTRERAGRAEMLGADAGAVVARLGADAVVGYHRAEDQPLPLPPPPDPTWGPSYASRLPTAVRRPSGALSLVAASGAAAWYPWGGAGADLDSRALLNAAEAIDALLAALAGRTDDDAAP